MPSTRYLLLEDQVIGSLSLNRHTPGEFPPEAVEVLKTFATQSALAIQNARLFREIAEKSRQLEAASRHKSEFLANMSHELPDRLGVDLCVHAAAWFISLMRAWRRGSSSEGWKAG